MVEIRLNPDGADSLESEGFILPTMARREKDANPNRAIGHARFALDRLTRGNKETHRRAAEALLKELEGVEK